MNELKFKIKLGEICSGAAFSEASEAELRVLVALIDMGGVCESKECLAEVASVSVSRAVSALSFWQESGIITPGEGAVAQLINEYEIRDTAKPTKEQLAKLIIDEQLSDMYSTLSGIMEKTLNPEDVEKVSRLVTELELDCEYILTLAGFLDEKNLKKAEKQGKKKTKLTSGRLYTEAKRLTEKDIRDAESLEVYIKNTELPPEIIDLKYKIGIKGRNLSETEISYFTEWCFSFGYSWNIIGVAFDEAALHADRDKSPISYMNAILKSWNEKNLRTAEACKTESLKYREQRRAEWVKKNGSKTEKITDEKPKYSNFTSEEAMKRALLRSYGEGKD